VTSGATSDLKQATRMARHMVVDCGMSARIGPVAVGGQDQSPATRQAVDDEVQSMLKAAYERVARWVGSPRGQLMRKGLQIGLP
jgi:ATP-dependent metalloprotease